MKTIISEGGRLVIPAKYRKALGIKPGDEVTFILEDGQLRVISSRQAVTQAQNLVKRYVAKGRSLSKELIKERKEEAANG